ncbi:NAD-dependent dehydratase [Rheinheimera sp. SA_1]|uniref:NAD-dependent 4,6-dehydratase LegB n=1 Tax=Rheinheimera sp. SA_1 TaxID=1827365 RepID=UPI0007FC4DFC|nr:NAD-dependent 4,6-dehydratase LegB [Rheinheimera sp. SA_1]OBP15407.1 NAD-dependent dehydratase [Rheinheimera sp. SA_1]
MQVLVTGADGFIGSHLVEMLLQQGYQVRALVCYNSFNSWGWLDGVSNNNLEVVAGDIRDPFFCRKLCQGIDTVFHLAALIAIPFSYAAPQSYVETNVTGTLNMCQAALDSGVKRFIQTSTSEVYGTALYVPIDEKHPLQAQSPYSASKIGADAMAMSYYSAFGLPVIIARPFNTYGPRQSARAVIPTIISQIATGVTQIKLGDTSPTRDFNYVLDTCAGFELLSRCDAAIGETVNISSNYEISVADTLDLIRNLMKSDVDFIMDEQRLRPPGSEVFRLWGDNSKLVQLTGFSPELDLTEGLRRTIDWFTQPQHLARYKASQYNK